MHLKVIQSRLSVVVPIAWAVGALCGVVLTGALPIWEHRSVATVNNPKNAHDQLDALLRAGWQIERVVPEHYTGGSELPTYVLRRPSFLPGIAVAEVAAAEPTPTPAPDPHAAAIVSRAHTLANEQTQTPRGGAIRRRRAPGAGKARRRCR
jgi:hypothetical protein